MSTIVTDDEIRIYYAGQASTWTSWPRDRLPPDWDDIYPGGLYPGDLYVSRAGLAMLRRDGFCHLESADGQSYGSVTTRPLVAPAGGALHVNVGGGQLGRSWVEVEALNADSGEPLPGLSRADGPHIWRDAVDAPVRWRSENGQPGIPPGRPFRLRFHLVGRAGLYSFWFAD
jgi:hypothetical protein